MRRVARAAVLVVSSLCAMAATGCTAEPIQLATPTASSTPVVAPALSYPEERRVEGAQALAAWASKHHFDDTQRASLGLKDLRSAVKDYPGDKTVVSLVNKAYDQYVDASKRYRDDDVAEGDAQRKKSAGIMSKAQTAMSEDFNVALLQAGPGTAYITADEGASLQVSSLEASATVVRWVDGDTVDTSRGRVRLVGVDTPEVSDTCAAADDATANAIRLAPPGTSVALRNPASVQDKDKYDRFLRYVEVGGQDVGFSQIRNGLGIARYDSRDGYDPHPRQASYRSASQGKQSVAPGCYAAASAASVWLLAASDDDHHVWVLTAAQNSTTKRLVGVSWDVVRRTSSTHLSEARHDARARIKRAKAEAARKAKAAQRAKEAAQAAARATAEAANSGTSGGSGGGSSRDPYPGYTGPRCYAPGGKTWRPC